MSCVFHPRARLPAGALLWLFLGCIAPHVATAQSTPSWVYRVDLRPYSQIFANGMQSWGDNDDVMQHVSGNSCTLTPESGGTRDSGFIGTTANEAVAQAWRNRLLENAAVGMRVFIYRIRPSANFYDAGASIDAAAAQALAANRSYPRRLVDLGHQQDEWLARGSIRGDQIESVAVWRGRPHAEPFLDVEVSNSNYDSSRLPQVSRQPYTAGRANSWSTMAVNVVRALNGTSLGACWFGDPDHDNPLLLPARGNINGVSQDIH